MITARKHSRHSLKETQLSAAVLPSPVSDLPALREPLLLRETPHAFVGDFLSGPLGQYPASPAFRLPPFHGVELQEGVWTPPVNVRETESELIVAVYVPGVTKGDIQVEIKNGSTLIIRGERLLQRGDVDHASYLRKEFSFRSFFRSFALPIEIDGEEAASRYRDGILEIILQKKHEAKQQSYRVAVSA
ncbi:MAG TPA: Hsp20/alpha crystallin family protein [Elusimicrobiota bacterium]|nr:Hsp20/alpha crystallin family protein [Elusimicrobiota bacterium]